MCGVEARLADVTVIERSPSGHGESPEAPLLLDVELVTRTKGIEG